MWPTRFRQKRKRHHRKRINYFSCVYKTENIGDLLAGKVIIFGKSTEKPNRAGHNGIVVKYSVKFLFKGRYYILRK